LLVKISFGRRPPARFVEIDECIATAPLGFRDPEIARLLKETLGKEGEGAPTALPTSLLGADVVALFRWSKLDHYRVFDRWGRCIAVVPTSRLSVGWESHLKTRHFVDSDGLSFSVEYWTAATTTVFTGAMAGHVRFAPSHAVIGGCDTRKGLLGLSNDVTARWARLPNDKRSSVLISSGGASLARRFPAQSRLSRKHDAARSPTGVLEFFPEADRAVRAQAIALQICQEIQDERDSRVG